MFVDPAGRSWYAGPFADPLRDLASQSIPHSWSQVLRLCERILYSDSTVRQALDRVLSYFLTDIQISGVDEEEREKYREYLYDKLGIHTQLRIIGLDYLCYGNSFVSVFEPFKRYLRCVAKVSSNDDDKKDENRECGFTAPLEQFYDDDSFKFEWSNFEFRAKCPRCGNFGVWDRMDIRYSGLDSSVRLKRWNPHEIDIIWDPHSCNSSYIWRIPHYYREMVKKGQIEHLSNVEWEIVEAIKHNKDLKFSKGVIFHLKEEPLAGTVTYGWGFPRILSNFRQIFHVQVLRRLNEAISMDYIMPLRVITPAPAGEGAVNKDWISNTPMHGFVSKVLNMIKVWRRDPASIHVLPFPIYYQIVGGDAKLLAPRDLLDQQYDMLLTGLGVPVELYKGSLSIQAFPTAARLFESNWNHLVYSLDKVLDFVMSKIAEFNSWKPARAKLKRPSIADDINRQLARLNLMAQGFISPETGLQSIGLDFKEEVSKQMENEQFKATEIQKLEERMRRSGLMQQFMLGQGQTMLGGQPADASAAGGGQGQGSQQGGSATADALGSMHNQGMAGTLDQLITMPPGDISPEEVMQRADIIAQDLLFNPRPEAMKDSILRKLKQSWPILHAAVKERMNDIRRQMRLAGGEMLMQQHRGM